MYFAVPSGDVGNADACGGDEPCEEVADPDERLPALVKNSPIPPASMGSLFEPTVYSQGELSHEAHAKKHRRPWNWRYSKPELVNAVFTVDKGEVDRHCRRMRVNWFYNSLTDKLFESICPQGIDVAYIVAGQPISPARHVIDEINRLWVPRLRQIFNSWVLVGYALALYGPPRDPDAKPHEVVVNVPEPDQYTLEFTLDQNATRHYTPRPVGHLASANGKTDETNRYVFENAELFFSSEPTKDAKPVSKTHSCLDFLLMVSGLVMDFRMASNIRNNMPMVVVSRDPTLGGKRTPLGAPFTIASGPAGAAATVDATGAIGGVPVPAALKRQTNAHVFATTAHAASYAKQAQELIRRTFEQYASESRPGFVEYVDVPTGRVVGGLPNAVLQRGIVPLPPNSDVAKVAPPDVPGSFAEMLRTAMTLICSTFGVPAELVLGAKNANHVTATEFAEEQLQTAVLAWQNRFTRDVLPRLYKKIYGDVHYFLLREAVDSEIPAITEEQAKMILEDNRVEFTFRSNDLDAKTAQQLYHEGIITGKFYATFVMRRFGLSREDVIVPPDNVPEAAGGDDGDEHAPRHGVAAKLASSRNGNRRKPGGALTLGSVIGFKRSTVRQISSS